MTAAVAAGVKRAAHGHAAGFCDRIACGEIAGWRVRVRVWGTGCPASQRTSHNCAQLRFPLSVCDGCRKEITVADLVGDQGWGQIVAAVGPNKSPDRDSMELAFDPIVAGHA